MRSAMHFGRRWAGVLLLALAGCGGGGGGGTTGSSGAPARDSETPPTSTILQTSLTLKSGAIRDVIHEGLAAHQQVVTIEYEGNAISLTGHTLYAKIVQPESVYLIAPPIDAGGNVVNITLGGHETQTFQAGHSRGTLQVSVCVDTPDCRTRLGNSPVLVDYDIEVLPGLRLSASSIQQSTHYGTAATKTLTVTPPADLIGDWSYSLNSSAPTPAGAHPASEFLVPSWLKRSGNTLTLAPPADLLPGTYAMEFIVDAVVPDGAHDQRQLLSRRFLVSHTVVPTGIYSVSPSSVEVTYSLSGFPGGPSAPQPAFVSQVGGRFIHLGVRSDSHPAAAEGNPLLATWLVDETSNPALSGWSLNYYDVSPLGRYVFLPVGTYRGALLMRHMAPGGAVTDFEVPITFTLTP